MPRVFCCAWFRLNEVLIELSTPDASGWGEKCALPATGRFFEGALPHNCIYIPRIVRIARTGANWCKPREPPSLVTPGQVLPLHPAADFCNKKKVFSTDLAPKTYFTYLTISCHLRIMKSHKVFPFRGFSSCLGGGAPASI